MEVSVEDKVRNLQHCLDALRAEVDTKMQIMEQILNTRNEQFVIQKTLIEKEHALYENVLSHWRSSGELGLSGQSNFNNYNTNQTSNSSSFPMKRTSSSAVSTSQLERPRHKAKRFRTFRTIPQSAYDAEGDRIEDNSYSDLDNSYTTDRAQDVNPLDRLEVDLNSGVDSDDGDCDSEVVEGGLEKRVFVNFYSQTADPQKPEDGSSDHVWLHFLREEKGSTALCKHCDNQGFHKIYQTKSPGLAVLRTHLKKKHKIVVEECPALTSTPDVANAPGAEKPKSVVQRNNVLRHGNYLYQRYKARNTTEYWRCNQYETCAGKLVRRNGVTEMTQDHSCLTTPSDCDASEFREKIREMAENHPTVSASDIIAAAKAGYSQEVLDLVPKDDSLRRTIRRIRLALESAGPCKTDWTQNI